MNEDMKNMRVEEKKTDKLFLSTDILSPEKEIMKGQKIGDKSVRFRRVHLQGIRKVEHGVYEITTESKPKSFSGKVLNKLHLILFGTPIRSEHEIHERLTKIKGLAVFASDNISSSAYATEEIMRVLILAGVGALALNIPITAAILILLAVVVVSYYQTISAYPSGGGSYIVAKDNLGDIPGLIAASALLIDYILTVAVSVSAGIYALTSALPALYPERVLLCAAAIIIITLGNLRGIRESGTIFALPVYIYIFSMLGVLGYGFIKYFTGGLPAHIPIASAAGGGAVQAMGLFLILRAFSSGACALTGVEAISNGIPAFKPPETKNAQKTLIWMALLFGSIFFAITFLAAKTGIVPDPKETESIISMVMKAIAGTSWAYYLVQFSTMLILILAANTSFADFPRMASFLARDKFLPSHFGFRGDRLAFNNGIIALSGIACILVIAFGASVTNLIPLYTIGVFIAFTLSQAGMVIHWWRLRERGWIRNICLNSLGAVTTFVVLIVVGVTKFTLGAWAVLLLIPVMVALFLTIRKHYADIGIKIAVKPEEYAIKETSEMYNYILIPVSDAALPALKAVEYAKLLAGDRKKNVIINAVHVTDNLDDGHDMQAKWDMYKTGVPLFIIESPYRRLLRPILHYIEALDNKHRNKAVITVLLPEVVSAKWWEHLYHTNTAFLLKGALFFRPGTVVISFPYHIEGN